MTTPSPTKKTNTTKTVFRLLLAVVLLVAGIGHFTFARIEFQSQVPSWLPLDADFVVLASGAVEILLGLALLFWKQQRSLVGWIVAIFFILIFPGNIAQFINQTPAFGLDSDLGRGIRLLFQPVLIYLAWWTTR